MHTHVVSQRAEQGWLRSIPSGTSVPANWALASSSVLCHPPAKQGNIQQSGKGIMLGLFWNVLGKAWTELQSPWILPEFLSN